MSCTASLAAIAGPAIRPSPRGPASTPAPGFARPLSTTVPTVNDTNNPTRKSPRESDPSVWPPPFLLPPFLPPVPRASSPWPRHPQFLIYPPSAFFFLVARPRRRRRRRGPGRQGPIPFHQLDPRRPPEGPVVGRHLLRRMAPERPPGNSHGPLVPRPITSIRTERQPMSPCPSRRPH